MSSKVKSALSTGALTALVVLLMIFVSGYTFDPGKFPPKTPPDGFEVALLGSEVSKGEPDRGQGKEPAPSKQKTASSTAAPQASTTKTPAQKNGVGQVNAGEKEVKSETKPEKPKEPEINQAAIYKGKRTTQNEGSGQGLGETNIPGNGGKETGKVGGKPNGSGGSGDYNLPGRQAEKKVNPKNNTGKAGRVVVRVCVDRNGNVIPNSVKYEPSGSNTADGALTKLAIDNAKLWHFDAPDNAPERQCGTITYIFDNTQR